MAPVVTDSDARRWSIRWVTSRNANADRAASLWLSRRAMGADAEGGFVLGENDLNTITSTRSHRVARITAAS